MDDPYRHRVHEAISVVHGQWVCAVLSTLVARPMRYEDLRNAINATEERLGGIHDRPLVNKVLTETLRRMRRDGLVLRTAGEPRVTGPVVYELTPMGRTLLRALRPLGVWFRDHQVGTHQRTEAERGARHARPISAVQDTRWRAPCVLRGTGPCRHHATAPAIHDPADVHNRASDVSYRYVLAVPLASS
jgi:DNA-binding HxlR family transcriptional regulator